MSTSEVFINWRDRLTALWLAQKHRLPGVTPEPAIIKLAIDLLHASDFSRGKDPLVDSIIQTASTLLATKFN